MSDLTVSYDYLAELGIEIKEVANDVLANSTASNTRLYVNFKRIEPSDDEDAVQSRLLATKITMESGKFRWLIPGSTDKNDYEPMPDNVKGEIIEIRGVVLSAETGAFHRHWDPKEPPKGKMHNWCHSVGYTKDGVVIKGLVENDVMRMYTYSEDRSKANTIPTDAFANYGLRGQKNMMCVDCIRSGQNMRVVDNPDKPGESKTVVCELRTQIIFYVTSWVSEVKVPGEKKGKYETTYEEYHSQDVFDEPGVILVFELSRTGRDGVYDYNNKKSITTGYTRYVGDMKSEFYKASKKLKPGSREYDLEALKCHPYFVGTAINLIKPEGKPNYMFNFRRLEAYNGNLIKEARQLSMSLFPNKDQIVLGNVEDFNNTERYTEVIEEEDSNPYANFDS